MSCCPDLRWLARAGLALALVGAACTRDEWTAEERAALRSLWIGELSPLPPDPTNRVADDPRAAAWGKLLFSDVRLSGNGKVSCATCHDPTRGFQDGQPLGRGVGTARRRTMSLVATAYSPFLFWDGRKDSQWSQALEPLEDPDEHGSDRMQVARVVAAHHRPAYQGLFGALPDFGDRERFPERAAPGGDPVRQAAWAKMSASDRLAVSRVFANVGKAIAAFERQLLPRPSRFDGYVARILGEEGQGDLEPREVAGLRLFLGKGRCATCHSGPLLTDHAFHNTGIPTRGAGFPDHGRSGAIEKLTHDEFNCKGAFSDAGGEPCKELAFLLWDTTQWGSFRAPSLRGAASRAPFMHTGQFSTLALVIDHYNRAPRAPAGKTELRPLALTPGEQTDLQAFLLALDESE
jgi:cytochrome c peroxidase